MFMNEVFLHLHLQLVALYASSDLWLNFSVFKLLISRAARVLNKEENRQLMGFSQEVQAVLDSEFV